MVLGGLGGRKFWEASFKQWGLAMQDDITDGVQLADQGRHCRPEARRPSTVASYGGYATLMGVVPKRLICMLQRWIMGVSEHVHLPKSILPYWKPVPRR